jgi:hypothetical protein
MPEEPISYNEVNYKLLKDWHKSLKITGERAVAMIAISNNGMVSIQCGSDITKAQMAKVLQDLSVELKKNSNITEN